MWANLRDCIRDYACMYEVKIVNTCCQQVFFTLHKIPFVTQKA